MISFLWKKEEEEDDTVGFDQNKINHELKIREKGIIVINTR